MFSVHAQNVDVQEYVILSFKIKNRIKKMIQKIKENDKIKLIEEKKKKCHEQFEK